MPTPAPTTPKTLPYLLMGTLVAFASLSAWSVLREAESPSPLVSAVAVSDPSIPPQLPDVPAHPPAPAPEPKVVSTPAPPRAPEPAAVPKPAPVATPVKPKAARPAGQEPLAKPSQPVEVRQAQPPVVPPAPALKPAPAKRVLTEQTKPSPAVSLPPAPGAKSNLPPPPSPVVASPSPKPEPVVAPAPPRAEQVEVRAVTAPPLVQVEVKPVVLASSPEKAWVKLDAQRTVIVHKGQSAPGLGTYQGKPNGTPVFD